VTSPPAPLTILELAGRLGRYRYVELALFTFAGAGAGRAAEPSVCIALSEASHAHAYRAELLERRLLVSDGLPHAEESTTAPGAVLFGLIDALAGLDGVELARELARVWYPAMLADYRRHLDGALLPSDGPVRRMLGRLVFDLERSADELGRVLPPGDDMSAPSSTRSALDAAGGPFGTRGL
jgi:hypothetical protein